MSNEYTTPHVHTAVHKILGELQVDKNGLLPGNMGSKPYIQATDVAAEVKKRLYQNGLFVTPHEEVVKHETIVLKDRINVAIVVSGTYYIISTVDGSTLTITGTGDGLAGGTAVASNIASTNAFKNAFLRFLLITEQSVEDEAKNGPAEAKTDRTLAKHQSSQASVADSVVEAKKAIQSILNQITEVSGTRPNLKDLAAQKWPGDSSWSGDASKLNALHAELTAKLESGEV